MTYGRFAYLYDELMKDVPYDDWIKLIEEKSQAHGLKGNKVLDLACGTGELSIRLASLGFDVTGVDLSEDMLTVAQAKALEQGVNIDFLQQDMTELELMDTYDIVGIFCDSLNYLHSEEEVQKTFQNIRHYLKKGGLFIFDVHSLYKMSEIFIGNTFSYDEDGICYIWNCFEGKEPNSVEHELTFFVEDGAGKYDRFDEFHIQRTFPVEVYTKWLEDVGFNVLEVIGDFQGSPGPQSERIFFIATIE